MRFYRGAAPAVLILAFLVAVVSACSETDDKKPSKPVATEGAATGDLFAYGVIERDGKPVRGATVEVLLSPEEMMKEAEEGESIPLLTATSATSGVDGSFALRLDPDKVPSKNFGSSDRSYLNFSLHIGVGKDFASWATTLHPVGDPKVWRTSEETVPADAALVLDIDVGTKRIALTDSVGETEKFDLSVWQIPG